MILKHVTKEWLIEKSACRSGLMYWENQSPLSDLGDFVRVCIAETEDDEALSHANWLLTKCFDKLTNVKYAVFAAEQVIGLYEKQYPGDDRPRKAIEAAKAYIENPSDAAAAAAAADAARWAADVDAARWAAAADVARWAAAAAAAADAARWAAAADVDAARWDAAAAAAAADAARWAAAADVDAARWDAARRELMIKILNYGLELAGYEVEVLA